MKLELIVLFSFLTVSCAFHSGNISTGITPECPFVYMATGNAKTTKVFGIGGLSKEALLYEAKQNLYSKFQFKTGFKATNYTADFKTTFYPFVMTSKATVSAEIYNCNLKDSILGIATYKQPKINGFRVGDSVLFQLQNKITYGLISHLKPTDKITVEYFSKFNKIKTITLEAQYLYIYKPAIENRIWFGFEIGEIVKTNVLVQENDENRIKAIEGKIIALNKYSAYLEFKNPDGTSRKIIADKTLIKK